MDAENGRMPVEDEIESQKESQLASSGILQRTEHSVEAQADARGIDSLPDVLIVAIVALVVSGLQDILRLSHVSARFRSLILSTPSIWADGCILTLRSTPNEIRTILDHSKEMPLKAHIESNPPYYPVNVLGIIRNSQRIDEMYISPVNNPILQDYFECMALPRLRRLSLRTSLYFPKGYLHRGVEHVYELWDMPELRFVDANFVPRPMRLNELTSCSLVLHESPVCASDLLRFLNSCRSLRFLSLSFPEIVAYQKHEPDVDVPYLRSSTLRTSEITAPSFVGGILERLSSPLLSELNVIIKGRASAIGPHDVERGEYTDRTAASSVCKTIEGIANDVHCFAGRNRNLSKFNVRIEIPRVCGGNGERTQSYAYEQLSVMLNQFPSRLESRVLTNGIEVRWDSRKP